MDPNEFKRQLEQFAELKQVKVPRGPNLREADEPDTVFRNGEEFIITRENNPTLTYCIKKIKHQTRPCEDCGNAVTDRITHLRICQFPEPHWRETCQNCGMTRNPDTGEFDLKGQQASNYFTTAIKEQRPISTIKFCRPNK